MAFVVDSRPQEYSITFLKHRYPVKNASGLPSYQNELFMMSAKTMDQERKTLFII